METACHPVIQLMVKRANPDGGTIEFQHSLRVQWGEEGEAGTLKKSSRWWSALTDPTRAVTKIGHGEM